MMHHASVAALRGTCSRLQVGAVVARDARVLVTGYNGAPAGMPHCNHDCTTPSTCQKMWKTTGAPHILDCPANDDNGCESSVHAEANAIAWAARHGVVLDGTEMFTTHGPCYRCAQLIVNAGVMRVSYLKPYRIVEGVNLLVAAGIEVSTQ
jgi:dCMP deaminase